MVSGRTVHLSEAEFARLQHLLPPESQGSGSGSPATGLSMASGVQTFAQGLPALPEASGQPYPTVPPNYPSQPLQSFQHGYFPSQLPQNMQPPPLSQLSHGFPPVGNYQSARAFPSSSQSAGAGSSTSPELVQGLNRLAAPSLANQVNQSRMASAARTLPRAPSLPMRVARGRGRGGSRRGRAPTNPLVAQYPAQCIVLSENGHQDIMNIEVKVYPSSLLAGKMYTMYNCRLSSFNDILDAHGLRHQYQLSNETLIMDLHDLVVGSLASSPYQYHLVPPAQASIHRHENAALRILGLFNRGTRVHGDVLMAAHPITPEMTVRSLYTQAPSKSRFGTAAFVHNGRFVIHLVVRSHPMMAVLPDRASDTLLTHSCISANIYSQFRRDSQDDPASDSDSDSEDEPPCPGCSELDNRLGGTSLARPGTPESRSTLTTNGMLTRLGSMSLDTATESQTEDQVGGPSPSSAGPSASAARSANRSLHRTSSMPMAVLLSLPSSLWSEPWTPSPDESNTVRASGDIDDLRQNIFEAATLGEDPGQLVVEGNDIAEAVTTLRAKVANSVIEGDFTDLLNPDRRFAILNVNAARTQSTTRSIGEGVEREIYTEAYKEYQDHPNRFLTPRLDETWSLSQSTIAHLEGPDRQTDLGVFGALTALMIISGVTPTPFDPVFLHYLLNNCDFASITSSLLAEWHHQIHAVITAWIGLGKDGDITPDIAPYLATFLDIEASSIRVRNTETHAAIAPLLLYKALIGSEGPSHTDTKSFLRGFLLPCRNHFDFLKAVKLYDGGSELMLSMLWTSQITSYSSIKDNLDVRVYSSVRLSHRRLLPPGTGVTLQALIGNFFSGSGIPCASALEDAQMNGLINSSVNLSTIDSLSFRSRMFYIAATGSDSVKAEQTVKLKIIGDDDTEYVPSRSRALCLSEGRIVWKTCFRSAAVPASYFAHLASIDYSTVLGDEPQSFQDAVDNWLLLEILTAIGHHGFL